MLNLILSILYKTNGLNVIARIANNPRIWQFVGKYNTLESLYTQAKKQKHLNLVTIIQSNIPIYQLLQHIKH